MARSVDHEPHDCCFAAGAKVGPSVGPLSEVVPRGTDLGLAVEERGACEPRAQRLGVGQQLAPS